MFRASRVHSSGSNVCSGWCRWNSSGKNDDYQHAKTDPGLRDREKECCKKSYVKHRRRVAVRSKPGVCAVAKNMAAGTSGGGGWFVGKNRKTRTITRIRVLSWYCIRRNKRTRAYDNAIIWSIVLLVHVCVRINCACVHVIIIIIQILLSRRPALVGGGGVGNDDEYGNVKNGTVTL